MVQFTYSKIVIISPGLYMVATDIRFQNSLSDFSLIKVKFLGPNKCKMSDIVAASILPLHPSVPSIYLRLIMISFRRITIRHLHDGVNKTMKTRKGKRMSFFTLELQHLRHGRAFAPESQRSWVLIPLEPKNFSGLLFNCLKLIYNCEDLILFRYFNRSSHI